MLGMGLALQHLLHRGRTGHADTLAPGNEPLGRPLRMVLVTLRQVLGHGGEPAFMGTAHVAGHPIATVQGFDPWAVTRSSSANPTKALGTL